MPSRFFPIVLELTFSVSSCFTFHQQYSSLFEQPTMYLSHFFDGSFLAIVLIHHMFSTSSALVIHQPEHQMIDHLNQTHDQQEQLQ